MSPIQKIDPSRIQVCRAFHPQGKLNHDVTVFTVSGSNGRSFFSNMALEPDGQPFAPNSINSIRSLKTSGSPFILVSILEIISAKQDRMSHSIFCIGNLRHHLSVPEWALKHAQDHYHSQTKGVSYAGIKNRAWNAHIKPYLEEISISLENLRLLAKVAAKYEGQIPYQSVRYAHGCYLSVEGSPLTSVPSPLHRMQPLV